MRSIFPRNDSRRGILLNMLIAFLALFVNGFGIHLTIRADLGSAPWDVLNLGLSNTLGILYGTASIAVSVLILLMDILLREKIGLAMFIDALTVGKAVDFFDWLDIIPHPRTLVGRVAMLILGLFVLGYTQYFYMRAALGCGPRDTLIVGLSRRMPKVPIGVVGIGVQTLATVIGFLLGGKVGLGTILCAAGAGPIMQLAFTTFRFSATGIVHQDVLSSLRVFFKRKKKG